MLNLFSYADEESDTEKEVKNTPVSTPKQEIPVAKKEEESKPASLFAAVPKARKEKQSRLKKLQTIAKFAGVSVDELMKEFDDDDRQKSESAKPAEEKSSSLSFLPAPQHKSDESEATDSKGTEETTNSKGTEETTEKETEIKENGIIPLNPFLSDVKSIQTSAKTDVEQEPLQFITVSRVQRTQTEKKPERRPETEPVSMPVQHGYGGSFSQSQYEAFIRRSGMMATVHAATSASANMLGEDAKYYDKQTKKALEEGAITELNQNDLHDHNDQPGAEYWEKRRKRQEVAEEFGKYAHIAPTQVQQTRNQITSLAAEAIVALAEQDERRAQIRKTKREIRAKYGW